MAEKKQLSFAAGEMSPSLYARTDINKYAIGLRSLRNAYVKKQGGAYNRPGTKYVAEVKDSDYFTRLVTFIFSDNDTYILEFGALYLRVFRNGAQVTVSGLPAWSISTPYVPGDLVSYGGANYYAIINSTNVTPWAGGPTPYWYPMPSNIYEIPTPYVTADLMNLAFTQSADSIVIANKNYAPRELIRADHTDWVLSLFTVAPSISPPPNVTYVGGVYNADYHTEYDVTAVSASGEESLPFHLATNNRIPDGTTTPIKLGITTSSGAVRYNIYRGGSHLITNGLIGTQTDNSFPYIDFGQVADLGEPPQLMTDFSTPGDYPGVALYSQQALFFASSDNDPEGVWKSRIGHYHNFYTGLPIGDDAPLKFSLVGNKINDVYHLREVRKLIALTSAGEWAIQGDNAGIIKPDAINANQHSHNGTSQSPGPVTVNDVILYVQARGNIIRDLGFSFESDGYAGNDLTIFSTHLFKGKEIVDWAYAQTPDSLVWIVLDDGEMLCLTYNREHEMVAWSRHDTDGLVESVCSLPEGNEDSIYVIVKRTIDSVTKRYIEVMQTRNVYEASIEDAIFMDCALTYDGWNTDTSGQQDRYLTEISGWTSSDLVKVSKTGLEDFTAADVGKTLFLRDSNDDLVKILVTEFINATFVNGYPDRTVPVAMRTEYLDKWAWGVTDISGLSHLEGKAVSVFADGFVLASPNNASYQAIIVASGAITIPQVSAVVHVGLPYISDLETLDIDSYHGEKKMVTRLRSYVDLTRGLWAGPKPPTDDDSDPLEGLRESVLRTTEYDYEPTRLKTDEVTIVTKGIWSKGGRIFLRQVDPLPVGVLSIIPGGFMPVSQGGA